MQVQSLGGKIPWRGKWQPAPVFLPEIFHGQESLAGYSPWGHKKLDTMKRRVCTHIRAFTFTLWATFNVQSKINTISKGAANSNNTKTKQLQRIRVALVVKNLPANTGDIRDAGSIPRSGRSPGGGHGNPLQYSCLENHIDRGAWQATVHRVAKNQTRLKWLSTHTHTHTHTHKD